MRYQPSIQAEYGRTPRPSHDIGVTTVDVGTSPEKEGLGQRRVKKLARWRKAAGALVLLVLVSGTIMYVMSPKSKATENFVESVNEPNNAMKIKRLEKKLEALTHEKQLLYGDNKLLANMAYEGQKQVYMLAKERAELEKTLVGQDKNSRTGSKVRLDFLADPTTTQNETHEKESVPQGGRPTEEPKTIGPWTRLARLAIPLYYTLKIKVYLPTYDLTFTSDEALKMEGELLLKLEVLEPTYFIEMNSRTLSIDEVHLQTMKLDAKKDTEGYGTQRNLTAKYVESEKITLSDGKLIEKGVYLITMRYNGKVETKTKLGLYATTAISGGKNYTIASTQFEPSSARKMLPCFDEPEYKAIWKVTVVHPKGSTAISNTPEIDAKTSTKNDGDWIVTNFEQTPKMSSYLLAIAVGKMTYIEGTTANGNVTVRLYATQELVDARSYLLNYTIASVDYFEQRFQIPYPLKKLDFLLVEKIAGAGMENYGLIIVGYEGVELKNGHRSSANLVAHEVAHQWFGNLVTMKWWNEIWLKEGLVTLFAIDTLPYLNPEFNKDEVYLEEQQGAFEGTKPIAPSLVYEADRPALRDDVFRDPIFYPKGAMIAAMLREAIGSEAFELALKAYLNKFSYGNTISADFLNQLQNAYKTLNPDGTVDIYRIGVDFITQKHHPVLSVTENDKSGLEYKVQQMEIGNGSTSGLWEVPLFVSAKDKAGGLGSKLKVLPKGESLLVHFDSDVPPIVNYDSKGFFRVCYSEIALKRIVSYLVEKTGNMSVNTITRVIYDAVLCDPNNMKHIANLLATEQSLSLRLTVLQYLIAYKEILSENYNQFLQSKVRGQFDKLIEELIRLTLLFFDSHEASEKKILEAQGNLLLFFGGLEGEFFKNRSMSIVEKLLIEPCLVGKDCSDKNETAPALLVALCNCLEEPSVRLIETVQIIKNSTESSAEHYFKVYQCEALRISLNGHLDKARILLKP